MIFVTDAAQKHFAKLLADQEPGTQIRVFVTNPGTYNMECGVSYCSHDTIKTNDIKLKFDLILIYVDELSIPYLKDARIDFIEDKFNAKLILQAPNAKINKISKDAPLIERVKYFLYAQINPYLANHGGQIKLIEITDDMYVVLQFSGGCNGCSMVNYTLKEGIEKQLLSKFPELNGVRDSTEHQYGKHSYY